MWGGISQQVEKRIVNKIDQLVGEGIRSIQGNAKSPSCICKMELFHVEQLIP